MQHLFFLMIIKNHDPRTGPKLSTSPDILVWPVSWTPCSGTPFSLTDKKFLA